MEKMSIATTKKNGYTEYTVCEGNNHVRYAYIRKEICGYALIIKGNRIASSRTLKAMKEGIPYYTPYEICGKYFLNNMIPLSF